MTPTPKEPSDFYTPQELEDYLKIPVPTLHRWSHFGQGPKAHKIGRHLRYRASDVEAWLESRRQSA
ncbi:MAG: helix-turn-helix transcriptional regulator [Actinomycetota bacterium]